MARRRPISGCAWRAASAPQSSALTIDEPAWRKRSSTKLAVAERLYDFACNKHGLPPSRPAVRPADLYDLHGNADDRSSASTRSTRSP